MEWLGFDRRRSLCKQVGMGAGLAPAPPLLEQERGEGFIHPHAAARDAASSSSVDANDDVK